MCITVRSLNFLLFTTRSPSSSPVPISFLLLCCTPPPLLGHVRRPQLCAALPRVAPPLYPPPVLPLLSSPPLAMLGHRSRATAMHPRESPAPPAVLSPISWLVLLSLSSLKQCAAIRPTQTPFPGLFPAFFFLAPPKSARAPRRHSQRSLHPAQIPAAHRSLTSSPSLPT
jgi:hypothetical protein